MRCDEARALLVTKVNPVAEAHLEACQTCFGWLEEQDAIAGILHASRPVAGPAPNAIAVRVLAAWRPARVSWRLGVAAAASLILFGFAALALTIIAAQAPAAPALAAMASASNAVVGTALALVAIPSALFFDNPAWLGALAVATVGLCLLWVRLYQRLQSGPEFRREVIR